jgi:hypothetical protein
MQRRYRDDFEIVCYPEEASDGWLGLALVFDVEKFEHAPDEDPHFQVELQEAKASEAEALIALTDLAQREVDDFLDGKP